MIQKYGLEGIVWKKSDKNLGTVKILVGIHQDKIGTIIAQRWESEGNFVGHAILVQIESNVKNRYYIENLRYGFIGVADNPIKEYEKVEVTNEK